MPVELDAMMWYKNISMYLIFDSLLSTLHKQRIMGYLIVHLQKTRHCPHILHQHTMALRHDRQLVIVTMTTNPG